MAKQDVIELEGTVLDTLPNAMFNYINMGGYLHERCQSTQVNDIK